MDVATEKLRLLYAQALTGFFVTLVNAAILVFLLLSSVPSVHLWVWYGGMALITLARFSLSQAYQRTSPSPEQTQRWRRYFLYGTTAAGCGWGAASLYLWPTESISHQAFFVLLMGGMGAGGVSLLAADLGAFCSFLFPLVLPLLGRLFFSDNALGASMGLLTVMLTGVLLTVAYRFHTSIVTSFKLRFANLDLVTQLSESNAQAETARQNAEAANRAKSVFLANMSHELRTPLHGILSFAQIGWQKAPQVSTGKVQEYFTRIDENGTSLLRLLDDLLDLAKLEAGKMGFTFARTALQPLVQQVVDEFGSLLAARQLRVESELPAEAVWVEVDGGRVQQVVRNLLHNAAKFSPQPGTIWVRGSVGAGEVRLTVQDAGPGIPGEELGRVFEKFVQSSRTATKAGGTGLGLAICQEIVAAHQGRIWAENTPQGGACFIVQLPLQSVGPAPKDTAAEIEPPAVLSDEFDRI